MQYSAGMPEVAAAAAVLSLGYGAFAGERQATAQRQGIRRQDQAQRAAEAAALSEERRAEQERNRANQKAPDLDVLLGGKEPKPGALGINPAQLLLGNRFLGQ